MGASVGNPGDAKSVGGGLSKLRIDYGPGSFVAWHVVEHMAVIAEALAVYGKAK